MTIKAKLIGHSHGDLETGDVTELSETAFEAFSDKFEKVNDEPEVSGNEAEGEEQSSPSDDSPGDDGKEFPVHRGGGWYELSNGESIRGKSKAQEMENEL